MSFVRRRTIPLLLGLIACAAYAGCGGDSSSAGSDPATETFAPSLGVDLASMTKLSPDLYIKDLTVGTGPAVAKGDAITVTYTGFLANGTEFDSDVGRPLFGFTVGANQVIRGWDEGFVGIHVGGQRLLVIGSALAYGPDGRGPIPPNSTLVFTVQVAALVAHR